MSPGSDVAPKETSKLAEQELGFETALEQLEGIVDRLEAGDLELEEALTAFERGVSLSRRCAEQLEQSERRVEILVEDGRGLAVRPFEEPEEPA
jgi:exodeoxyribonuclease VII small subunit